MTKLFIVNNSAEIPTPEGQLPTEDRQQFLKEKLPDIINKVMSTLEKETKKDHYSFTEQQSLSYFAISWIMNEFNRMCYLSGMKPHYLDNQPIPLECDIERINAGDIAQIIYTNMLNNKNSVEGSLSAAKAIKIILKGKPTIIQ